MSTETGVKHDHGKTKAAILIEDFPRALTRISEVATFGANKYTRSGWLDVPNNLERYSDAFMRHLLAAYEGEQNDPESGFEHLHHAAWNLLAVVELKERMK